MRRSPTSPVRFLAALGAWTALYFGINYYLLLAEQVLAMAEAVDAGDPAKSEQVKFAARTLVEMLSPAHFPLTNPLVVEKTLASRGENLVKGMEHLLADLRRGHASWRDAADA